MKKITILDGETKIMITINDIVKDMKEKYETDFYYLDNDNIGYQIHRCWDDTCYYFRYEKGNATAINSNDFLLYITSTKCNLYSVCDDTFYSIVLEKQQEQ